MFRLRRSVASCKLAFGIPAVLFWGAIVPVVVGQTYHPGKNPNTPPHSNRVGVDRTSNGVAGGTVIVEWSGPDRAPVENQDYFVSGNPPDVVLYTQAVYEGKTRPVTEWRIGCLRDGQPANLGNVTAEWTGTPSNITVKVGTIATPVANVGAVDIASQGPGKWSNIELDINGHLGSASCVAAGTTGGRISGTVDGVVREITAYAIGTGTSNPGTLSIPTVLNKVHNVVIPSGSMLQAGLVLNELDISDLVGDLDIGEIWYASGASSPKGRLHIQAPEGSAGNITIGFQPTLEGRKPGGGKVLIEGSYAGDLHINKMDIDEMHTPKTEPSIQITGLLMSGGSMTFDHELLGSVEVQGSGTSDGDMLVDEHMAGDIEFRDSLSGDVTIRGDLVGTLTIGGTMSGKIMIGGNLDAEAMITIGTFTGDICAANIVPGEGLPANLHVQNWGSGATICDKKYCTSAADCYDALWCTSDACEGNVCLQEQCIYGGVQRLFGDVRLDDDGEDESVVDKNDILAITACYGQNCVDCGVPGSGSKTGCDVYPCAQNNVINLDDIFAVLDALAGEVVCNESLTCGACGAISEATTASVGEEVDFLGAAMQLVDLLSSVDSLNALEASGVETLGSVLITWVGNRLTNAEKEDLLTYVQEVQGSAEHDYANGVFANLIKALSE